jgi:biopolymer transport protein TolR
VKSLNDDFERDFWSGTSLNELFAAAAQNAKRAGPMERIFASGMREYQKLRERRVQDAPRCSTAPGAPCAPATSARSTPSNQHLSFLASVGSVSPYVGLFGTVWGIMHAFTGLASLQQVTLATVAPGIAEALVATAIGLFAAIPAVVRTTASPATSTAWPSSWRPSSRSSPTSCSATPAPSPTRAAARQRRPLRGSDMPAVASRGRGRRTINEINMVPFIDVMLVLLIIFMVTAPLITPSLIDLPSVDRANKQPDKPIEIVIKSDDEVQIKKDPSTGTGGTSIPMTQIGAAAKQAQGGDDQRPVVISADKSVKYETVVKAMNQLKRSGVERVGLSVTTTGGK